VDNEGVGLFLAREPTRLLHPLALSPNRHINLRPMPRSGRVFLHFSSSFLTHQVVCTCLLSPETVSQIPPLRRHATHYFSWNIVIHLSASVASHLL